MATGEVKQVNGKRVASTEYRSWQMMKNRCLNPKAMDFRYYGGRGIGLDASWLEFDAFLADMGRKPTSKHTLERLNNSADYARWNCVWATRKQQARNRDYCRIDAIKAKKIREVYKSGVVTQKELAKEFGVSQRTISLITRNEAWQ